MQSGCVICYDSFNASSDARYQKNDDEVRIVATLCGHVFHNSCINEWLKRSSTCPECRRCVRKRSLTKLFINFCIDNNSDINAEESLDALKEQLCGKDLECVEKDKKIIELQIDCAVSERKIQEKDEEFKKLQTCFANSELESWAKDEKIEELQTCFARSELESLEKDEKIEELQTYYARSERDVEKMLQQQMKLNNEISAMKQEVKKLSRVEDANQKLLQEKNTLPSEPEHLNTVETIVEGCPIDVKKILADVQVHVSSEEGKIATQRIATYFCSLLKQELARSREEQTHLQNELTKVKKEIAHSEEEKTQLPIELKLVKHKMRTRQSVSRKRIRQLRKRIKQLLEELKKFKDLNSSSSMSLSCGPSNVPVIPSLPNNHSSQCSNLANCTLVCSPSRDSSSDCKNQVTPITADFSENKRRKISIFNFVKKYSMASTQSPETPVLKRFVLGKEEEPSTIQRANYVILLN